MIRNTSDIIIYEEQMPYFHTSFGEYFEIRAPTQNESILIHLQQ